VALTTYTELQATVTDFLRRDGDTALVAAIPDLIVLAEAQFNRDIRHRRMETTDDLTLTGALQTVALPTDYIEARAVVLQTSPLRIMSYVTPVQLDTNWSSGTSGVPTEYTIIGANMKVGQIPDSGYTVELTYYQQIPDLATNSTNWLLTNHPDMYLYGALLQAAPYIGDDERIPVWASFYDRAREGLKDDANRSSYSGGPLYTRVGIYTA
tara:strand:+ start:4696 stop:5328 length:633 start_codon:yes stop_codon:yes gene_type:complete